jgi:glutaredoxin
MMQTVTDKLRVWVNGALSSERGNQYRPVRLVREALGTANDLVGRPFCSADELRERRGEPASAPGKANGVKEQAPVMVYFDGKDHRTKKKVEELLKGRAIAYQVLDVTDDEATRSWAVTQAGLSEFPLVFVAGEAIGGLHELTQADVNGRLKKKVFG